MKSPINFLLNDITASVINIAPEKSKSLLRILNDNNIIFAFNDKTGFVFNANPVTKLISASIPGLNYLWCSVHFYYLLYQKVISKQKQGEEYLNIMSDPELLKARELFIWAQDNLNGSNIEWPENLSRPITLPTNGDINYADDIHVTSELFLCAVAWILHHEIQHIILNHQAISPISLQDEKDADKEAVEWLLGDVSDNLMIEKRALGITIAILVLTSLELDIRIFPLTHPKAVERMQYCLTHDSLDENHLVYSFAIIILKLYIDDQKIEISTREYDNFRDCFDDYCFAILRNDN